jgi:PAS domain S-box-containing protein
VGGPPHLPQASTELDEFFDLSIDLLCIVGFDGYFKRVNAALARSLGYPPRELFSRSVFEVTHPDDREPSRQALAKLQDGQDLVGFESRVVCADGSVRWLEWNTHTVPERGIVYGVARDTTERRRTDADLREAHRLLASRAQELSRLAEEQAALKRVATLVAQQTAPDAVFAAVGREVGQVLGVDATHLGRYEADGTVRSVAQWGSIPGVQVGATFPLEGDSVSARVLRTGRPARMDGYEGVPGVIAATVRATAIRFAIGVPIWVEGRAWGVMIATSKGEEPFPAETESRLQHFTELQATAIANAEARAEVARLADEQAALRRVATLVAEGRAPATVFDAVTAEVCDLMDAAAVVLGRYDDDDLAVVATSGSPYVKVGERYPLGGTNVTSLVQRTGRPARLDEWGDASGRIGEVARAAGIRATVATPVTVDGATWGVLIALWDDPMPPADDTEERLANFAEMLDTAIGNAHSRDELAASRARVLAAGDDARRRVVRDLHDGAQQRLIHTTLTLKLAQQALREDRDGIEALVGEALENAERATEELRELAHGILPSVLSRGGLRPAVAALAGRSGLPVEVEVTDERLPPDVEASAYFILAEAITNVVKHARATRATASATIDSGVLTLEVRDDGVGGADLQGHGLVGIADRVDALGGRMEIGRTSDGGTSLTVRLPLAG